MKKYNVVMLTNKNYLNYMKNEPIDYTHNNYVEKLVEAESEKEAEEKAFTYNYTILSVSEYKGINEETETKKEKEKRQKERKKDLEYIIEIRKEQLKKAEKELENAIKELETFKRVNNIK